jgi:VWFA-related protein
MKPMSPYLFSLVLCCSPLLTLAAQQPNTATAALPQADHQITLDAVVTDASGNTVPNLGPQAFTVLDDEKPQKLLSFQAVQGTATNPPLEVTLVVDMANASFAEVSYERSQVDSFLRQNGGKLALPTRVVVLTDTGAKIEQLTRDGNALADALKKNATALRTINADANGQGLIERFNLSLGILNQLATYEAKRPGRKELIWISPGWPTLEGATFDKDARNRPSIFAHIVAYSTMLRKARITLYSIDPSGTTGTVNNSRAYLYEGFLKPVNNPKEADEGALALQVLALHSGGLALRASNNLIGEIETCLRDANNYYTVSFTADPAERADEYRPLSIKVSQPGVTVRTSAGYYTTQP